MNCNPFLSLSAALFEPRSRFLSKLSALFQKSGKARAKSIDVLTLAETISSSPALRRWVLIAAGQGARARRALLAKAAAMLKDEPLWPLPSSILGHLADESLHLAVVQTLLARETPHAPQLPGLGRLARPYLTSL